MRKKNIADKAEKHFDLGLYEIRDDVEETLTTTVKFSVTELYNHN